MGDIVDIQNCYNGGKSKLPKDWANSYSDTVARTLHLAALEVIHCQHLSTIDM